MARRRRALIDLTSAPAVVVTPRTRLVVSDPAWAAQFADTIAHSLDDLHFIPGWRKAADPRVAADSLQRSIDLAGQDVIRHVFDRAAGDYVGRLDLHSWDFDTPRCELGYFADSRRTGTGLLTEAAAAMLDIAWDFGAVRIQAMCDARNLASIRFAERIAMQREGTLRSYELDGDGQVCDQVMLAIVRRA